MLQISQKIKFEIDNLEYTVAPCYYDDDQQTVGLEITFPTGDSVQVGLYNFDDESALKKFVKKEIQDFLDNK